jgi:hypothetical protein
MICDAFVCITCGVLTRELRVTFRRRAEGIAQLLVGVNTLSAR